MVLLVTAGGFLSHEDVGCLENALFVVFSRGRGATWAVSRGECPIFARCVLHMI